MPIKNYEYVHSLLATGKRSDEDTVVIYVPNFDHANFDRNPIFAIADILDDSLSGGEDRIWGAYIDEAENDEVKYIILDEDHARNTGRPVFIFDTRFIVQVQSIPAGGNPIEGAQAQTTTGDKYFISYVKSFEDLDNDNRMEIRYGHYIWNSYVFQYGLETYDYDNLNIYDNRLFKLQLGGGIGISYSDYIPYARYYWGVFPGSLPGMISQYIFEIQPIIDPMADLQIPITSSITFQMSGGIKTYFLNYAMNNTGLNYSNNDLFGLIYWGGGLRFKL